MLLVTTQVPPLNVGAEGSAHVVGQFAGDGADAGAAAATNPKSNLPGTRAAEADVGVDVHGLRTGVVEKHRVVVRQNDLAIVQVEGGDRTRSVVNTSISSAVQDDIAVTGAIGNAVEAEHRIWISRGEIGAASRVRNGTCEGVGGAVEEQLSREMCQSSVSLLQSQ